jgi:Mn-dependent DtxR family transcriptional regulator
MRKILLLLLSLASLAFLACKNEVKPVAITTPVATTVVIDSIREHRTYNDSLFRVLQVEDSAAHADSIRAANIADSLEFRRITKLINGGYNGFDDRWKLYQKAKEVLK